MVRSMVGGCETTLVGKELRLMATGFVELK